MTTQALTRSLILLPLLWAAGASAADTVTLRVVVEGLKTTTGTIRACVFSTPENFPSCEKGVGVVSATAPANAPTVTFDIPGVKPGQGAVSLFVDVDDTKTLERGMMGIPKEPIGFSNNAVVSFGPPKFDKAAIAIGPNTSTTIKLKYF